MADPAVSAARGANEADLSTLCRSCGLCCDGSLFGRVDLEAAEIEGARKHHLRLVTHGATFEQPCAALAATGCVIYSERPASCRRFTCHLYEKFRREGGPVEGPLAAVRRVRSLLATASREEGYAELAEAIEESFGRS